MTDPLPDLLYPCVFGLAQACQLAVGRLYTNSSAVGDISSLFESVPAPRSQPGAMLAVETLNGFIRCFERIHHERFHLTDKGIRCNFRPDRWYTEIHVRGLDWQTLDIPRHVRASMSRYGVAFASAHRSQLATLAVTSFAYQHVQPIERLARDLCCSPSTLRRQCKALTGASPVRSRTHRRLREAFDLLRTTTLKIESIAAIVGWKSAKDMYANCRALFGMTPAAIRRLPDDAAKQLQHQLSHLPNESHRVPAGAVRHRQRKKHDRELP